MRKQQKGLVLSSAKGFTLIELLVVIAIIGILSTIVMVSLNTARTKANDVAIKAGLKQVHAVAALLYDANPTTASSYDGLTKTAPANMAIIDTSITSNGGTLVVNENDLEYCAQSVLKSVGGGSWCVDSTGYAGIIATCDGTNATCAAD